MEREISTLEDALAAIRELSALIHKQAEDILNLKKELAAVRAEIITLKSENAALKKQNAKLEYENAWLKRQIFGSKSERFLPAPTNRGCCLDLRKQVNRRFLLNRKPSPSTSGKSAIKTIGRKSRLIFPVRIGSSISRQKSVREWS